MRILVVEDEPQISKLVKINLEHEGFEVVVIDNGKQALQMLEGQHFDLMILDIMLPDISGFQICEQVRIRNMDISILMLSAKDTSQDRITGLKLGADDYLTKPFHLEELLLRVTKLLDRKTTKTWHSYSVYEFGNNKINFDTYEAAGISGDFTLTKKEALLLKMMVERKNEVVSRQQILQNVWGYDVYPSTRTIDNFILSFRKYFEVDPKNPKFFYSVRGVGYKFVDKA